MITETVAYIGAFVFSWVLLVGAVALLTEYISKAVVGYDIAGVGTKHQSIATIIQTTTFLLFLPVTYLALSSVGHIPPFVSDRQQIAEESQKQPRIVELRNEVERISQTLSGIENLSIVQIREELTSILSFVEELRIEAVEQETLIRGLRKKAEEEEERAEETHARAETALSITEPQLDVIRQLVTRDARDESMKGFWLGVMTSLPIGIGSSLFAAYIVRKRKHVPAIDSKQSVGSATS